jgi:hypothetical protein
MVTFLTIFLILGLLAVAIYFWQRPGTNAQSHGLTLPPKPASLFALDEAAALPLIPNAAELEQERVTLIERAGRGDKNALHDARRLNDQSLYDQTLDRLIESADNDSKFLALLSFLTRSDLPVNSTAARAMLETWKRMPDRGTTAKMLHVAALANDASVYNDAVATAMQFWREKRLSDISPEELRSLFEGEFWQISGKVRSSGAGFVLKRTLAQVRSELEAESRIQ